MLAPPTLLQRSHFEFLDPIEAGQIAAEFENMETNEEVRETYVGAVNGRS
jgi:hypothetical protein